MLRRSALDEIGLFDERFFMYSEDEDLCFRLRKNNWWVCYTAAGTAIHGRAASARQNREEMLKHFYASQMLFLTKHHGGLRIIYTRRWQRQSWPVKGYSSVSCSKKNDAKNYPGASLP
jgi:GT2 family glycosyltransferase